MEVIGTNILTKNWAFSIVIREIWGANAEQLDRDSLALWWGELLLGNQSHKTSNGRVKKKSNSTSNRFSIIENEWLVIFRVGETIHSAYKDWDTSENIKQVLIWFILFALLHDSLTLQIILRVKPIISQRADGSKRGAAREHGLQNKL